MYGLNLALIMILAAPGPAKPTYLACVVQSQNGPFIIDLTIDEVAQTVTTAMPTTGYSERHSAVFSPTSVSFGATTLNYVVSRVDLSIERSLTIGDRVWVDRGMCKVQTTPKRAF